MSTHVQIDEWLRRQTSGAEDLIPASTVVVIRDGADGLETLLMRRSTRVSFAEGAWVFPGGRIDSEDLEGVDDEHAGAVVAAVREAKEEADLELDPAGLVHYAHWVPPPGAPVRYSTWFFLAVAPAGKVTVDQGEITEHAWLRPTDALRRIEQGHVEVFPPTWITLFDLEQFATVDAALSAVRSRGARGYASRVISGASPTVVTWEGDVAYESGDPAARGPLHRLVMAPDGWRFQFG